MCIENLILFVCTSIGFEHWFQIPGEGIGSNTMFYVNVHESKLYKNTKLHSYKFYEGHVYVTSYDLE